MKISSNQLPVIFSAPHSSSFFAEFQKRTALTCEQRYRFSDYGTDRSIPSGLGQASILATRSRALGDSNRSPEHPQVFPDKDFPSRHQTKYGYLDKDSQKEKNYL